MSWTTAVTELRQLLNDGPTDRLRHRKRVFGDVNGTNVVFKTLEFRRVTNFTTAVAPLGVFVNGSPVTVATDFAEVGEFNLSAAPVDGDVVEATYYTQHFLDAELEQYAKNGALWLTSSDDLNAIVGGLRPAVLNWGAGDAYQKLALKWAERLSETYRLEDQPDPDRQTNPNMYQKLAQDFYKKAKSLRDDFYTRQGQNLQPLFGVARGNLKNIP
jgi:hypothetical protein